MDVPMCSRYVDAYRRKRDLIYRRPERSITNSPSRAGRSTSSPKRPGAPAAEFVAEAIENNVLIIPGNIFSRRDTHFRISYAASDQTIERGIEALRRLAG